LRICLVPPSSSSPCVFGFHLAGSISSCPQISCRPLFGAVVHSPSPQTCFRLCDHTAHLSFHIAVASCSRAQQGLAGIALSPALSLVYPLHFSLWYRRPDSVSVPVALNQCSRHLFLSRFRLHNLRSTNS
jgi:hypothetical protein